MSASLEKKVDILDQKLDRVIGAMVTQDDVHRLEKRTDALEEKFDRRFTDVMDAIDKRRRASEI